MMAYKGDIYFGLWYPVVIAAAAATVSAVFITEPKPIAADPHLRARAGAAGKD